LTPDPLTPDTQFPQPNWDEVSSKWIDLIRPVWHEKIKLEKNKLFLMKEIRRTLNARESEIGDKVLNMLDEIPRQGKPEERIKACIIGIPDLERKAREFRRYGDSLLNSKISKLSLYFQSNKTP
jgi:hypothetical protein